MFEVVNPHLLQRFEYMPDSAGAGQWRGGLGVVTELEFLDDGAEASIFGDGDLPETAAFGLFGGGSGLGQRDRLHLPRRHASTART